ncbi:MAG TPA: zf-TFIIB domain-containing protein [Myxococcota bacterium]|nr:zf-TFIIB domain-containing protein [Myxococcota bacterium]
MKKGKDLEADYFTRESIASKHITDEEERRKQKKAHDEELKALHYMKCPKCGHDLETKRMSYIDIDQCSSCGVLVLKPEDVDRFVAEEKSILKAFIDFFKS